MQTAAPYGAATIQMMSYDEGGGGSRDPLPFPNPPNTVTTRRQLRQAASDAPYADTELQVVCQGGSATPAMLAALNSSAPSQILTASGEQAPSDAAATAAAVH